MKVNYIDNGDSFAHIIKAYFELCGAHVEMYRSDCSLETAARGKPDIILLGPGPNGPREAGIYMELLDKYHKNMPFFGICLGFQAMMEYFGEPVMPLDDIVHGDSVPIFHNGRGIFEGIENGAEFARYNSLGVPVLYSPSYGITMKRYKIPECFDPTAETEGKHSGIVMGARHKTLPIEGIQFHPESVLSMRNDNGIKLVNNVVRLYREIK